MKKRLQRVIGIGIIMVYIWRYIIVEKIPREIYEEKKIYWNIGVYAGLTCIYAYVLYRMIYKKPINKIIQQIIEEIYYKPIKEVYKRYIQDKTYTKKVLNMIGKYTVEIITNKKEMTLLTIICDLIPKIMIVSILYYEIINRKGLNYFYKSLTLIIIVLLYQGLIYAILNHSKDNLKYYESKLNIISKTDTSVTMVTTDRENMEGYKIHYNIVDTFIAIKFIKDNDYSLNKIYIMIVYHYVILWLFCVIYILIKGRVFW